MRRRTPSSHYERDRHFREKKRRSYSYERYEAPHSYTQSYTSDYRSDYSEVLSSKSPEEETKKIEPDRASQSSGSEADAGHFDYRVD